MKNRVFLLAALMACGVAQAQTDTVHIGDPWYLYNVHPHLEYTLTKSYPVKYLMAHYAMPDTSNMTVYGIAYTCYNFPFNRGIPLPTFYLYREIPATTPHGLEIVDTARTDDYWRTCHFMYEFTEGSIPSNVVPCYEFYFDTPHPFGDLSESFWISRYWSQENAFAYNMSLGNSIDSTNGYWESCAMMSKLESATHQMLFHTTLIDTVPALANAGEEYKKWGKLFPIVRLRCATPTVRLEGGDAHSVSVSWSTVEQPEQYQIALAPAGTDPSEGTVVTLPDTVLNYTFIGLDSAGDYEIRVRKGCRYRTSSYDTTAYSDWSEPIDFQVVGIGEVEMGLNFSVCPNPARGSVEVTLGSPLTAEARLTLSDVGGRNLFCLTLPAGCRCRVLDIGDLSAGIYILKLVTQGSLVVRRLMKE